MKNIAKRERTCERASQTLGQQENSKVHFIDVLEEGQGKGCRKNIQRISRIEKNKYLD